MVIIIELWNVLLEMVMRIEIKYLILQKEKISSTKNYGKQTNLNRRIYRWWLLCKDRRRLEKESFPSSKSQ
jgi:hypothetical protein